VFGNAMILCAVLGFREMKSPTNIFLASLAMADLLLCIICLPVKVKYVNIHSVPQEIVKISYPLFLFNFHSI